MLKTAVLAACTLALMSVPAEARRKLRPVVAHPDCNVLWPCQDVQPSQRGEQLRKKLPIGEPQKVYKKKRQAKASPSHPRAKRVAGRVAPRSEAQRGRVGGLNARLSSVHPPPPTPPRRPASAGREGGEQQAQHPPTATEFLAAVLAIVQQPLAAVAAIVLPGFPSPKPAPTIAGYVQRLVSPLGRSLSLAGVTPKLADKARELERECGSYVISAVRNTRIAGTRRISLHASGEAVDMAGNPDCMYARLKTWRGGVSTDYARIRPAHIHISLAEVSGREMGARFKHGVRKKKMRRVQLASAR